MLVDLDFASGSRAVNLLDPASAQDAATKAYVDASIEGLAWKDSCRVSPSGNVSVASPGATLDSITMATNDRVLLRNQTTTTENGPYVWNGAAVPMTRTFDGQTGADLEQAVFTVEEGTAAGSTYRQTTINFMIGVGSPAFTTFGTSVGVATTSSTGTVTLATQTEVNTGTDAAKAVTPATLTSWASAPGRYTTNIGDGSSTSYTVTHNLNTYDVDVTVCLNSGTRDDVQVTVQRASVNAVTILFSAAPTTNQYRVKVSY